MIDALYDHWTAFEAYKPRITEARLDIPDRETLREFFDYDPETGILSWKKMPGDGRGRSVAGSVAGTPSGNGYLKVRCCGKLHYVHRIIFKWMYGWVPSYIDHVNQRPSDNRLVNLRPATAEENAVNRGKIRQNPLGRGVTRTRRGKFAAYISVKRKNVFLGHFDTAERAADARLSAERNLRAHHWNASLKPVEQDA